MLHTIPGTRLTVPSPVLAYVLLALGLLLMVVGTLAALKVRRHMMAGAASWLDWFMMRERETLGYLLHDYDESDKPLILMGLAGRFFGGLLALWAAIGLFVA